MTEEGSSKDLIARCKAKKGQRKSGKKKSFVFPVIDESDGEESRTLSPFPYSENEDILLPEDYKPTKYDVINGRGRKSYNHIANRRFRQVTAMNLKRYQSARCKVDKTLVVIGIVNSIRKSSPTGGFIKKCPKTGRWISMSDEAAREKVGHCLRDMIASQRSDNLYTTGTKQTTSSTKGSDEQMMRPEAIRPHAGLAKQANKTQKSNKSGAQNKVAPRDPVGLSLAVPIRPQQLVAPPMGNLPQTFGSLPCSFNNFDIQDIQSSKTVSSQDMSLQQRKILQKLESGFKGTVEELIEAVR